MCVWERERERKRREKEEKEKWDKREEKGPTAAICSEHVTAPAHFRQYLSYKRKQKKNKMEIDRHNRGRHLSTQKVNCPRDWKADISPQLSPFGILLRFTPPSPSHSDSFANSLDILPSYEALFTVSMKSRIQTSSKRVQNGFKTDWNRVPQCQSDSRRTLITIQGFFSKSPFNYGNFCEPSTSNMAARFKNGCWRRY